MVNAQTWLDSNYPLNQRQNITKLLICNIYQRDENFQETVSDYNLADTHYLTTAESLTGALDLSSFSQLESLRIKKQFINKLVLTDCRNLEEVYAEDNLLKEIILPQSVRKLDMVSLVNNNFYPQNLFCFSRLTKLRYLYLGTSDSDRIRNNIYNRWNGSLVHLQNLIRLRDLDINATDVDSGLEFLPTNKLMNFLCGNKGRENAGVNRIKEICRFTEEEAADEDIDENLWKAEEIRGWQERQENHQAQIEIQTNR